MALSLKMTEALAVQEPAFTPEERIAPAEQYDHTPFEAGDGPARALQLRLHQAYGAHVDDPKLALGWRVAVIASLSVALWAAIGAAIYLVVRA